MTKEWEQVGSDITQLSLGTHFHYFLLAEGRINPFVGLGFLWRLSNQEEKLFTDLIKPFNDQYGLSEFRTLNANLNIGVNIATVGSQFIQVEYHLFPRNRTLRKPINKIMFSYNIPLKK